MLCGNRNGHHNTELRAWRLSQHMCQKYVHIYKRKWYDILIVSLPTIEKKLKGMNIFEIYKCLFTITLKTLPKSWFNWRRCSLQIYDIHRKKDIMGHKAANWCAKLWKWMLLLSYCITPFSLFKLHFGKYFPQYVIISYQIYI